MALKQLEESSKSYAGELEGKREEVTRLKAEMEKLKEEHAAQIIQVTESASSDISKAKDELADKEKMLRAEINGLREENLTLRDAIKVQKDKADIVAKRMAG